MVNISERPYSLNGGQRSAFPSCLSCLAQEAKIAQHVQQTHTCFRIHCSIEFSSILFGEDHWERHCMINSLIVLKRKTTYGHDALLGGTCSVYLTRMKGSSIIKAIFVKWLSGEGLFCRGLLKLWSQMQGDLKWWQKECKRYHISPRHFHLNVNYDVRKSIVLSSTTIEMQCNPD